MPAGMDLLDVVKVLRTAIALTRVQGMYMIGFVLEVLGSDTVLSLITFKSSFLK